MSGKFLKIFKNFLKISTFHWYPPFFQLWTDLTQSSTTPDHVSDFLATVQLANKEFDVEHPEHHQLKIIEPTKKDFTETIQEMSKLPQDILIPRRPVWTSDMTKEQLDRGEKDAFLTWRRELAEFEEASGAIFTPFEKNIEFWRQLWRVIERSGKQKLLKIAILQKKKTAKSIL